MLKRVAVVDLRVGMHIHEFCGSWLDHPFWRSSFRIADFAALKRIRESGISEAWIDTEKGLDVAGAATRAEVDRQVEHILAEDAVQPHLAEPTETRDEIAHAAEVCVRAREAMATMFAEARMGRAIDIGAVVPVVEDIADSVQRNPGVLVTLARLRTADDYTFMHSIAVCGLMIAVGRQVGLAEGEAKEAGLGGLLHDIGKVTLPLHILHKRGPLTEREMAVVQGHSEAGHAILVGHGGVGGIALEVCLHHHERIDGSGYPHRLAGDGIGRHARMAAVCDVYDAITSERPYKQPWSAAHALRKMAEWAPTHFDTPLFHAFVKSVGIYPIGTLVMLESGRLGVIVDQTEASLLRPKVKVFYSATARSHLDPEIVDLSGGAKDAIVSHEDPAEWGFDVLPIWSGLTGLPA